METQKLKGAKPYFLAAIGVAAVGILLYAIVNIAAIEAFIGQIWTIISPVVYGFCIAYLCNPIMKIFDEHVFHKIKLPGLRRTLSLLMTAFVVLLIITAFLSILIPSVVKSLKDLINNYNSYLDQIIVLINNGIAKLDKLRGNAHIEGTQYINPDEIKAALTDAISSVFDSSKGLMEQITDLFDENSSSLLKKILEKLFPYTGTLINKVYALVLNTFFSILIAFHLLASKETRLAQIKKIRKAIFSKEQNIFINRVVGTINRSFGNYIVGKMLDSTIIFLLCLFCFWIFDISEYFVLIAVLIGITDIIPVIGPLIGAVPGGFIILITNPSKFILYVILVLLIQQLEGNIISPKILGDQMGVSALCVLVSIVVMGSIFEGNPLALILSVPLFAVMVELGKIFIESRLKKKGLPLDVAEYYRGDITDDEIDMAAHYQNRKLTFFYEHSKLKKFLDKQKEKKQLRKLQLAQQKQSVESVCTDVTDEQNAESNVESVEAEQAEAPVTKE